MGLDSAGGDGISAAALEAYAPALALTSSGPNAGVPTVAWLDARDPGSAQVLLRQFFVGATFPLTINVSGDGSLADLVRADQKMHGARKERHDRHRHNRTHDGGAV